MSWFNTNTVQGRFGMIVRAQYLKYTNYYATGATTATPGAGRQTRRPPQAVVRARVAVREPAVDVRRDARTR